MKYDAITIDTNIFTSNGYALEHGLLKQLEQFKQGSVKFVLSEIVVREVLRHITEENVEIRTNLDKAINRAKGKRLLTTAGSEQLVKITQEEPTPEKLAQDRVDQFIQNTGCEIVGVTGTDVSALVNLYFEYKSPFENNVDKKNEFPDAIALMSLEKYAADNNLKILVVSKDRGWADFAASSDWLDVRSELTTALSELQIHVEKVRNVVASYLQGLEKGQYPDEYAYVHSVVDHEVSVLDVYAEANSYLRVEAGCNAEISFHNFCILNPEKFSVVRIGKDFVVAEIPVNVQAHASADFDFYVYDSIDKDEIYLGSNRVGDMEIDFNAAILLTMDVDFGDAPEVTEVTEVELIKAIDSLDFGEIEPYFEPDYED